MPRKRQHGGPRTGNPGAQYPNRSDLQRGPRAQPVTAASGQTYGVRAEQEAAQRQIPLPAQAPIVPLSAPTQRPTEPLTAGLPIGAGPGPEVLSAMPRADDTRAVLAAWYAEDPSPEIADMLAQLDAQGR